MDWGFCHSFFRIYYRYNQNSKKKIALDSKRASVWTLTRNTKQHGFLENLEVEEICTTFSSKIDSLQKPLQGLDCGALILGKVVANQVFKLGDETFKTKTGFFVIRLGEEEFYELEKINGQ